MHPTVGRFGILYSRYQLIRMDFYQKLVVLSHAAKFMPLQVVQLRDVFVPSYHIFVVNVAFDHYIKY